MVKCKYCDYPAAYELSLSDANVQGYNKNEAGYSWQPVCMGHYLQWKKGQREHAISSWAKMHSQQVALERSGDDG